MNITFISFGTRGDVQPTLALARALQARGHRVRMIASSGFAPWIARHGIEAVPARVDIQALMMGAGGQDWVRHGNNPTRQMQVMKKLLDEHGFSMMEDAYAACRDAEAVVSSFTSDLFAVSIVEKLGALHFSTPLQPALVATRSGSAIAQAPLPGRTSLLNYLFGRLLMEPLAWRLMQAIHDRFRQDLLRLPAQSFTQYRAAFRRATIVQGFSDLVVPPPPDWPSNIHTAGYWFLDEDAAWQLPPDLQAFLDAGEPPVYIGFGSMTSTDAGALTDLILKAVALSGTRALLQAGWAGIGGVELPPSVHLLGAAPHHRLFPRLRAVVHHGGAGTTAEGLRAGVPTVIVPHLADQPFWGARVKALGVGPAPIPRSRLTAENLAAAIRRAATDPAMRANAAALGEKIRAQDGVAAALRIFEAQLSR